MSSPKGVAPVTASAVAGLMNGSARLSPRSAHQSAVRAGQVVIATGKAACRKARPNSAGLKMFSPRPPKMSLPKPMPNTPPRKAIHSGNPAGRHRPSSRPVIIAEPSASESRRPPNSRSVTRQPATLASSTSMALGPKKRIEAPITGSRLSTTDHMMRVVDSAERTCGAAVILTTPFFSSRTLIPPAAC